jgi:acyl carrier protein
MGDLTMTDDVKKAIKQFILSEFLPGEDPAELTDTTPLITGGILDSIATLKLVLFIEERYVIALEAHEVDPEHLNTIEQVARLILSKNSKVSYERA